jgi:hypothetical protein
MKTNISGKEKTKQFSGQSTLELTLVFVVLALLLFGMLKVFFWVNQCIVQRHRAYRSSWTSEYNRPREFYHAPDIAIVPE